MIAAWFITGEGVTNSYDGFGRPDSQSIDMGGVARTLSYQHDAAGNRTRVTHPSGRSFTYAYDGLGRPIYLFNPQYVANQNYYPHGLPWVTSRVNGTWSGAVLRPR
jgi:YD repeat-containing protein